MLSNKKFKVNHHKIESKTFNIINGLQQGTVNAPTLFNIYLVDLLNKIENIIAFADDIIIYHPYAKIEQINQKLQDSFNIVEKYTLDWNMKINVEKCETILFRPPLDRCNNDVKRNWKKFKIKSLYSDILIPNRESVKYLGIHLDKFLYFNDHVKKAINKAQKAFFMYKHLFYTKYLKSQVKIILYKSLIRPIITYGCPIWYNISPFYMEKIRVFERKCLRACTSLYRSPESDYLKYINNKKLYNVANINRIDNFIIQLIRNSNSI